MKDQVEKDRRRKKIKSLRTLAGNIQELRSKLRKDLSSDNEKTKLTALAIALMDKTAERVGNEGSAENGHFGVTGFQRKHVKIEGDKVKISYVGKSGVQQEKSFSDKALAKAIGECRGRCSEDGTPLLMTTDGFKIRADKVNRYLKDFGITAKDIRGYAANKYMLNALKKSTKSSDPAERKKKFKEILKSVAEKVGHQAATLSQHYLLPNIESKYVNNGSVMDIHSASIRIANKLENKFLQSIAERIEREFYAK